MANTKKQMEAINEAASEETAHEAPPTKGQLRAKIFSAQNMDRKTLIVPFYGAQIELRQPTVGEIEKVTDKDTQKFSLVQILIDQAYVPGTNEKMFDFADMDQLKSMPFSEDMSKVADAIAKLTNVQVKAAEKN